MKMLIELKYPFYPDSVLNPLQKCWRNCKVYIYPGLNRANAINSSIYTARNKIFPWYISTAEYNIKLWKYVLVISNSKLKTLFPGLKYHHLMSSFKSNFQHGYNKVSNSLYYIHVLVVFITNYLVTVWHYTPMTHVSVIYQWANKLTRWH
jgi:hypothetical protein